jgi:hypothetical protein
MMPIRTVVPLLALVGFGCGCGGNGPDDPLTGTWSRVVCFGDTTMPSDIQSCKLSLRFDANLTFALINARQSMPATAVYPRCNAVRTVTGLTYSTNTTGTLTLSGSSVSTLERTGCVNDADNQAAVADTRDSVAAGAIAYSIKNDTLTLSAGQLAGEYKR